MKEITIPAKIIFSLGPVPITDANLGALLVTLGIFIVAFMASRKFSIIPTRIQIVFEMLTEYVMEQLENAFGDKERARNFFPMFITLLLFLIVANELSLVPLIFQITYQGDDLFRLPASDFSLTVALALTIFVISHIMALKISPINHLKNFIAIEPLLKARKPMEFFQATVDFMIGFLNIIGEFAKVISLSARLFGNLFAGEVMVMVIISLASFTRFIVPIPFIVLSQMGGLVQALVFFLLSIQFIALAIDGATPPAESKEQLSHS
ncbi:hypothetical protein COY25_04335 [Candidatus Uhrbacteria bacterium CG_4_10_14_0_2_um_filter_41_7]|uniref:ATP synthase subunit a n=1 Tax=Candidatus Uhrbacteria bacterium CG_4_9_14_3_um_filter_41_35 TaxID=1975034 RepID=A0A2M7XF86_9BACT|nr:MAG: hypothetical protein COY25_04335 [Candidatus Uhrbacteria bacterium CG_4_10_14_0_2_um_filter_41_7]PJA46533.1 MAG: hypothetical protein CO173_02085 [Candidatus Uhrbacteria bacterium CG_4_9_14_3_um_filter_41_35]